MSRRVIILAATKAAGRHTAITTGINAVAIITPRSLTAAYGINADTIMDDSSLTAEMREYLLPFALPSVVTGSATHV